MTKKNEVENTINVNVNEEVENMENNVNEAVETIVVDEMAQEITIFLPTGRATSQTVIADKHATTDNVERWFEKVKLVNWKAHGKGKGCTITLTRRELSYRDGMLDIHDELIAAAQPAQITLA